MLDTYSRRVVGWSIDSSPTGAPVTNALGMAIDTRLGKHAEPGTIIHSDHGHDGFLIEVDAVGGLIAGLLHDAPDGGSVG